MTPSTAFTPSKSWADVLFAPGLPDLAAVGAVCAAVSKPVNFMVGIKGKSFSVGELAAARVRRISLSTSGIDSHRIAVAGHSFGGQLTLLAAERDKTIRAAVTFAGAAGSWERSPELRERLFSAISGTNAAIMLTHAENDFGTAAGRALAVELEHLHKPYVLKIYPPVGLTLDDGHNMLYENIPAWGIRRI